MKYVSKSVLLFNINYLLPISCYNIICIWYELYEYVIEKLN